MGLERIVVRISPDGQIQAETVGVKGEKCLDSIALLEELLEAEVVSSRFTDEYDQTTNATEVQGTDELRQY